MRHAFSMDTGWEQDLQTIAETIVNCKLKQKTGSCRVEACQGCPTCGQLERCLGELSACDVLRVKNMAQELYEARAFQYGLDKPTLKESVKETMEAVGVGLLYFLGPFLFCFAIGAGALWLICAICGRG